jgi:hypothetical protein
MITIDEAKTKLTEELSEQYSQNRVTMEEYERIIEYIHKIETGKEIAIIEKVIQENKNKENNELIVPDTNGGEKHLALFSWRSSMLKPVQGNAGNYLSLFGANRIVIEDLPKGKTILTVNSIFGLTEIIVAKDIKIINKTIPVFAGIFAPNEIYDTKSGGENEGSNDTPELYITGTAIFGNITIIRK